MTSQSSRSTGWRRAATGVLASGALFVGLATAPLALADPEEPVPPATPDAPASPIRPGGADTAAAIQAAQSSDQVLQEVADLYDTGAGGGQVSKLIRSIGKLRNQGFLPARGDIRAIQEGLDQRPNLVPLREALEQTLSFQQRNQQRSLAAAQSPVTIGVGQIPPINLPPFG